MSSSYTEIKNISTFTHLVPKRNLLIAYKITIKTLEKYLVSYFNETCIRDGFQYKYTTTYIYIPLKIYIYIIILFHSVYNFLHTTGQYINNSQQSHHRKSLRDKMILCHFYWLNLGPTWW